MKQQIIIIGGGTTFISHEDYVSYLKNKKINLERLRPTRDWKESLQEELGEKFEVFVPKMPNVTNARYEEWKIWFVRILSELNENIIIIGHSLGGIFIAKYLSENKSPKKIKAVILLAAPYDDKESEEPLAEFNITSSLDIFTKQVEEIYLIQSKDDPVVAFSEFAKYKKALPNAKTLILDGMGHFKIETFPEIVDLIKSI